MVVCLELHTFHCTAYALVLVTCFTPDMILFQFTEEIICNKTLIIGFSYVAS